jgi:hypothetical protein
MSQTNDAVWLAFQGLAKTYPRDNGVRLTVDLSRWLLEERQQLGLPAPLVMRKAAGVVPANQREGKNSDIHDLLILHVEAWGRLSELIDICSKHRDAGNLKVAQQTFCHARRLLDEVNALEQIVGPKQS